MSTRGVTDEWGCLKILELGKEFVDLIPQNFEVWLRQINVWETWVKNDWLLLSTIEYEIISSNAELSVIEAIPLLNSRSIHGELSIVSEYGSLVPSSKLDVSMLSSDINRKHFVLDGTRGDQLVQKVSFIWRVNLIVRLKA